MIDQDLKGDIEVTLQHGRIHMPTRFHGVFEKQVKLALILPERCLVVSDPRYKPFYDEEEPVIVDYGTKSESFIVPSDLRIFARLGKKVVVLGAGNRVELWNPRRFQILTILPDSLKNEVDSLSALTSPFTYRLP